MAKRKAVWQNNYIAKAYDRINLLTPKGKKADMQAYAAQNNESLNAFINRAIDDAMKKDTENQSP